jgi:hypothetical protein
VALTALPGCAETGGPSELDPGLGQADTAAAPTVVDASTPSTSTPNTSIPWSNPDDTTSVPKDAGVSTAKPDSSTPSLDAGAKDAGDPLGDILGTIFKDSGAPDPDAGFKPPPDGGGEWKLNPGSFVDCPPEPPPIPIIGGLCAGIYYGCGWTNTKGDQYSCVCDWVHWLCI